MILKSITPYNFGPFLGGATLELDPDVTVLTGPNDVGKSFALRAIELVTSDQGSAEWERNRHRKRDFEGTFADDKEVKCDAVFEISALSKGVHLGEGSILTFTARLNSAGRNYAPFFVRQTSGGGKSETRPPEKWPRIIRLPISDELSEIIDLRNPSSAAMSQFVRFAFGQRISSIVLDDSDEFDRTFIIGHAEETLNNALKKLVPADLGLAFKLRPVQGNDDKLAVAIQDRHFGFTPFGSRGLGVRRLINVMGPLLTIQTNEHVIILYDEPETSLHADAQHTLRRVLESLGSLPNVQVVYSTHSPAMINGLRPSSIRLLQRTSDNGRATTRIFPHAETNNYYLVRASLGVLPGDSLLFGTVTLIVEGATEARCIPLAMELLCSKGIIDRAEWERIKNQLHIIDGEGTKVSYMCRLVEHQRTWPVVFVDGDNSRLLRELNEWNPTIPAIKVGDEMEFEDVIPRARYIEALATFFEGGSRAALTLQAFDEWNRKQSLAPQVMFSKRVTRWLQDLKLLSPQKPQIMVKALETTPPEEILADPFQRLMKTMSDQLDRN